MLNDRTEIPFRSGRRIPAHAAAAIVFVRGARDRAALSARTISQSQVVDTVGLPVFSNLVDAIRAGYHVLDGTPDGYVVSDPDRHGLDARSREMPLMRKSGGR
jgi:hypothetical protein